MSKITDYPKATPPIPNANVFLMDGPSGTQTIQPHDLAKGLRDSLTSQEKVDGFRISELEEYGNFEGYNLMVTANGVNKKIGAGMLLYSISDLTTANKLKKLFFRGLNLGSVITEEQLSEIDSGRFRGLYLGDFWNIGGVKYRIADFDYWWGKGDTPCYVHHIVIMPDDFVDPNTYCMNNGETITNGYSESKMSTENINNTKNIIRAAFGSSHILKYRDRLANAVQDGLPTNSMFYTLDIELPNEPMIFGTWCEASDEISKRTCSYNQLALFTLNSASVQVARGTYWLRDIAAQNRFSVVAGQNTSGSAPQYALFYIRPVFGICKENAT